MNVRIGLIGAGAIACKHLDVIRDIDWIEAVGITSRTISKAEQVAHEYEIPVCTNDVGPLITETKPDALMVFVSADQTYAVCSYAIPLGLPLFIEKPPGLTADETKSLVGLAKEYSVGTMIGYNRRFYSIFHKGIEVIRKYGELMGVRIEAHERFWKLADKVKEPLRSNWIYANGTHTIDLLRFFGGEPSNVCAVSRSRIEKNGDQFAAVMELDSGAIGHYSAHWYSPGGWSVVLYGEGVTVEFNPLESGRWIDKQFKIHDIEPDEVDLKYKPGFYAQMEAFGKMVHDGKLAWPGQDLAAAYRTMILAQKISSGNKITQMLLTNNKKTNTDTR